MQEAVGRRQFRDVDDPDAVSLGRSLHPWIVDIVDADTPAAGEDAGHGERLVIAGHE